MTIPKGKSLIMDIAKLNHHPNTFIKMKRKDILYINIKNLLTLRYLFIFTALLCIKDAVGQLNLNFNDGNINTVKWVGNNNDFVINTSGQLQLKASGAGESSLFTKYKVPADSLQYDLYFKLQFAPSNDNYGKIYLFTDNVIESVANGYYLRLGENGSNDAIQVWKLTNGTSQLMGSGASGALSLDPADARVRFKIYRDGMWIMATDYNGNTILEEDLVFSDQNFILQDSMYFGVYCKYTATRIDKFFFDDIVVKTVERDTSAPIIVNTEVINDTQLKVVFSESLESTTASNFANYTVDNGLGSPDNVIYMSSKPQEVVLNFTSQPIKSGINYTLTVQNVRDKSNNHRTQKVNFVFSTRPTVGDIVISEVLTNPYSGGSDFIEIYNKSDKFIKLDSLTLRNAQRNEYRVIRTPEILYPGEYMAISQNVEFLKSTYAPPTSARFLEATIPTFNVSEANISIMSVLNGKTVTIDSFDYRENMHFVLIDEKKGVSLERINLNGTTNDANNWHSASTLVKFATPGYKNSNQNAISENNNIGLTPDKKVFSPNGDGFDDFVLLNYTLEKPGYLATIKIFDAEGFPVYDLTNNFLLGTEGAVKWDGIDAEGNIVKIGMYIIYCRLFHTDGDIIESKNVVVAAQNF